MKNVRSIHLASCAVVAVVSLPLILGLVPPNGLYGFRVHDAYASPAVWYEINRFSGIALLLAAAVSVVMVLTGPTRLRSTPWLLALSLVVPIIIAVVVSLQYLGRIT